MDKPISAMIVDDDLKSREVLEYHLRSIPGVEIIASVSGADEAYRILLEKVPDIVFLDVEMPGKSGFDLVADLVKVDIRPCIIFQTAFDKYAIRAIKSAAFDYLLKPFDIEELKEAIAKFRMMHLRVNFEEKLNLLMAHLNPNKKIRLHTHNGFILVDPGDIYYCEADWNYSIVHYGNDQKETLSINLGKLVEMLPKSSFIRISRSVLINMKYLTRVMKTKHTCVLSYRGKEEKLTVSKKYLRDSEMIK